MSLGESEGGSDALDGVGDDSSDEGISPAVGDDAPDDRDVPGVGDEATDDRNMPGAGRDAADGSEECGAGGCDTSVAPQYACSRGGCNEAGGVCTAPGRACHCFSDAQCLSSKCVPAPGENDVACGTECTGAGAADAFGCLLASPGIPGVGRSVFAYAPSNFAPTSYSPPANATTINCNTTYDASAHAFTGWCAGQTQPNITPGVAQTGGPPVDILAFSDLTITAGSTLTIVPASTGGGNAVILAVYGDADIQGAIHADGKDGTSGSSTPGTSGAGGNYDCGVSAGTSQPADGHCSAGGGGGASASGGVGAGGVEGSSAPGGAARSNTSLKPLFGGCPGGTSGSWACRTSGGGGGGAIQISTAGLLAFTGVITANGGNGGTSTCFSIGCGLFGYGGGGGGAGSGGAILLEGQSLFTPGGACYVNGGKGGAPNTTGGGGAGPGGVGGNGGAIGSTAGAPGTGSTASLCGSYTECGGGGGGSYGYFTVHGVDPSPCSTPLAPAPVLNTAHTACVCVADSNCSSGKCVDMGQCTGSCTGVGTGDVANCQVVTSAP
jgi:hypothetical protein